MDYSEPNYFFVKKDFTDVKEYEKGFKLDELFLIYSSTIESAKDQVVINFEEKELYKVKHNFSTKNIDDLKQIYSISNDKINQVKNDIENTTINKVDYRPFDSRYILYSENSQGVLWRPKVKVTKHFLLNNIGIIFERGNKDKEFRQLFISENLSEVHLLGTMNSKAYTAPLYLYPDENSLTNEPVPNFNMDIIKDIEKSLNLNFGNWTFSQRVQSTRVQSLEKIGGTEVPLPKEKAGGTEVPLPKEKIGESEVLLPKKEFQALDLFDYIYAVLHSPSYREKYKEFLKIDFPRVPYPKPETFWQLVSLGGKLRILHLLEDTSLDERIIDIKGEGELLIKNSLNKKDFSIEDEKVELRLNDEVSVVNIPLVAWEFYIGGYQPAQKWLKDRVGRVLNRADMKHYNRIINALCKTDLIMKKIDEVL